METNITYTFSEDNSFLISTPNIITIIGNGFLELIGYSKDEIINKSLSEVFTNLLRIPQEIFEQIDIKESIDCYIFTKSLEAREVVISSFQGKDAKNKTYLVVEKPNTRLDEKIIFVEQLFKDNTKGVAIYSVPNLVLLKANQMFLDFKETPFNNKEYIIGKSLREIVKGFKGSEVEVIWDSILETQKGWGLKEFRYDNYSRGITYWDSTLTPIFENGKMKYIFQTSIEVTEMVLNKRKLEEQNKIIQEQKEQLEAILENMIEGVTVRDKCGNMILINATAKKIMDMADANKNAGDVIYGNSFTDLDGVPISSDKIPMVRALKGETVKNHKLIFKQPDKESIMEINATPIYLNNELIMAVACSHDITESVRNQRIIENQQERMLQVQIEKEKNEALKKAIEMKDEFLSLISHEFKTPITVINSAIQAMEFICKDELSHKAKGYLKKIQQNSLRQLRLVNNILDITRISSGHFRINKNNHDITFITKAIVKSIYLYTQQKGIYLAVSSKMEKKVIGLDEEKYERILLNLLSNAIKFTPIGKRILITISSRKGFVCIKVKDEGIGIPKDKQAIIFERFGQVDSSLSRQAEGSGIGLSLVKMLVESMGGSVSVKSKVGIGSTFTVLLPNIKTIESFQEKNLEALSDNRLIQATAIEFSDIYL